MSPLSKGIGVLFGLPAILAVVFIGYFNITGEARMRALCGLIGAEMPRTKLNEFVLEHRLEGSIADTGTSILGNSRSYGRHVCKVTLAAGIVKAAEYGLTTEK